MTQEQAANELLAMYAMFRHHYDDVNGIYRKAITLAIDALAASAANETAASRGEDALQAILEETRAIRAALEKTARTEKGAEE